MEFNVIQEQISIEKLEMPRLVAVAANVKERPCETVPSSPVFCVIENQMKSN